MKEVLDSRFFVLHYGSSDDAILAKTTAKLAQLRRERRGIIPSIVVAETTNFVCARPGGKRPGPTSERWNTPG